MGVAYKENWGFDGRSQDGSMRYSEQQIAGYFVEKSHLWFFSSR